MCGIAGFFNLSRAAEPAVVDRMLQSIRHRGPDDQGIHIDGGCGIGMRRLSIIDLSSGHQPIPNEDESCWIVFNGEIYNYQALRQDLLQRGHRFRTESDTETILHAYEEYGADCLSRLRGMFALAIWDTRRRELFLGRDRLGKKPLYYSASPAGLFFGSEIKCLRAAGVPLEMDEQALRLYFRFGYVPDPHSAFQGIRKLPPGHWLRYRTTDGQLTEERYWRLPAPVAETPAGFVENAAPEQIRECFDESVRLRMIADVPLGAFLSGGIDSGLVVASMARQSSQPVKTFSIGFEEATHNELPWARQVAERYGTDHHELTLRPDSVALIQRLAGYFDEPFGDSSAVPTYLVSEFAVQQVKVALSGDGGDELFGGYPRFAEVPQLERWRHLPGPLRAAGEGVSRWMPYHWYGKNYLDMVTRPQPLDRYLARNWAPRHVLSRLLEPRWLLPGGGAAAELFEGLLPSDADPVSQAEYWEATVNLPGDMLVKVDRMSMACSLEVRCPLLDHRLAELAASLPHRWRIRDGQQKYALLKSMGDRLPETLLRKPKSGFGMPISRWFRNELRPLLHDYLLSPKFTQRGFTRKPALELLIAEHQEQRRDNSSWLWNLLMLELWMRDYFPAG